MEKLGLDVLQDAKLNKFTAFTLEERIALNLRGLLPTSLIETQDRQMERELAQLRAKRTELEKYIHLMTLLSRNERLFYYLLLNHVEEMVPLVYTPVVGEACLQYSNLYLHPIRGIYLSLNDSGSVDEIFKNYAKLHPKVRAIVVTDGERILGLGDLGANGMGIPMGKLQLYVAMGGIDPSLTLPITLDVGTNNQDLLASEFYIGLKQPRERGSKYYAFVDEFVQAVRNNFGKHCLIQWEDFGNRNAFELLQRYRDQVLSFNDDIQGTAAVTLAAILASLKVTAKTRNGASALGDHTFLFFGAGEAGVGIAELIADGIVRERNISKQQARERIWLVDSRGLVCEDRGDLTGLLAHKRPFAHKCSVEMLRELSGDFVNLEGIMRATRCTALIGVSAQPHTFTLAVCKQLSTNCERPLIFALSNPTEKAECTAEQAIQWTEGRCLFCSGSPFPSVQYGGKCIKVGQANNAYIFPGLALGVLGVEMGKIPNELFEVCASALASQVSPEHLEQGSLFPPLADIRKVSARIAAAVGARGYELGLAQLEPRPSNLLQHYQTLLYAPNY